MKRSHSYLFTWLTNFLTYANNQNVRFIELLGDIWQIRFWIYFKKSSFKKYARAIIKELLIIKNKKSPLIYMKTDSFFLIWHLSFFFFKNSHFNKLKFSFYLESTEVLMRIKRGGLNAKSFSWTYIFYDFPCHSPHPVFAAFVHITMNYHFSRFWKFLVQKILPFPASFEFLSFSGIFSSVQQKPHPHGRGFLG